MDKLTFGQLNIIYRITTYVLPVLKSTFKFWTLTPNIDYYFKSAVNTMQHYIVIFFISVAVITLHFLINI